MHCCGNTDWSVILSTSLDMLSFDAYHFTETLALYPGEVKSFLDRGGILAWGIVPSEEGILANVNADDLVSRLLRGIDLLAGKGVPFDAIARQSLVTPSCGLASLPSPDSAQSALRVLAQVSAQMQSRMARWLR
jgi:hypothetical protein